jgi:hypothetical protein
MKIRPAPQLAGADKPAAQRTRPKDGGPGFQQVLETALEGKSGQNPAIGPPGSASLQPSLAVEALNAPQAASGIHRMERLLDALASYQQRLQDSRCPLRDIAPSLGRLESEHCRVARWAETATMDEALRSMVNESLVTTTLEIHRFRSGVYC